MSIGTNIATAASWLHRGKLVAMPTETVYGLAGNALQEDSLSEIFRVKERPSFDPLILHLAKAEDAEPYVMQLPPAFTTLYNAFCPGPLTFVLPKSALVPELLTAGHPTVALRFPRHPVAQELLRSLPFPLAAPSANKFGRVSPTTAAHVAEQLGGAIPYILDGGSCEVGLESTIIDLSTPRVTILRLGGIALEHIEATLGERVARVAHSSSNPKAPGMLTAHYSPSIPLLFGKFEENLKRVDRQRTGTITFCRKAAGVPLSQQRILSPKGDLGEAAARLFAALRSFSNQNIEVILACEFPEEGLGRAINDRLRRAAQPLNRA